VSWKPTNELRFVRRETRANKGPDLTIRIEKVLQQKWVKQFDDETGDLVLSSSHCDEQWRDVPVVDE
jgi:hypothetical protein